MTRKIQFLQFNTIEHTLSGSFDYQKCAIEFEKEIEIMMQKWSLIYLTCTFLMKNPQEFL